MVALKTPALAFAVMSPVIEIDWSPVFVPPIVALFSTVNVLSFTVSVPFNFVFPAISKLPPTLVFPVVDIVPAVNEVPIAPDPLILKLASDCNPVPLAI